MGTAGQGRARLGAASAGMARPGKAGRAGARYGRESRGKAPLGLARIGKAELGGARRGKARQGLARLDYQRRRRRVKVRLLLEGVSPLIMHNIRLSDPRDEIVRQIKALTSKKTGKTDADLDRIEELEWFGGLYYDPDAGPYVPPENLKACIKDGAKARRKGAVIASGLIVLDSAMPVLYQGPRIAEELWADPNYRFRRAVDIQGSRTMRMRPIFRTWSLKASVLVNESLMNLEDFREFVNIAGEQKGLGEYRPDFGRFKAVVEQAD